jgi:hypothetical protein
VPHGISDPQSVRRQFKLSGYTTSSDPSTTSIPPIAVMLQPSFTNTQAGQAGGAAPGFGNNNNFAVTQLSVFYAGRLLGPYADRFSARTLRRSWTRSASFNQTTYDGVAKAWHWDNTELRFANTTTVRDQNVTYGVYANNNPTMQDPLEFDAGVGLPVLGLGPRADPGRRHADRGGPFPAGRRGRGLYDGSRHVLPRRRRLPHPWRQLQNSLGIDPTGETQIGGLAPYWRLACGSMVGDAHWEIGAFGMAADTYPGRDQSAGKDGSRTSGWTRSTRCRTAPTTSPRC